ncbi:MAG: zinc ribbon domain-containing protein [Bacteroidetes bacterium]|nr:zinc ribbon domain-containing protein [Bacteroidota bacterium]
MPTYDYACKQCGHRFEAFQSMKDDALTTCPQCEAEALQRLIGAGAGLVFKGSGFYLTDYKKSSSTPAGAAPSNGSRDSAPSTPSNGKAKESPAPSTTTAASSE